MAIPPIAGKYSPSSFLLGFREGLKRAPLVTARSRKQLIQQVDSIGPVSSYDDVYPVVRGYWFQSVRHFVKRLPYSQARVFSPQRLSAPLNIDRIQGGRELGAPDDISQEIVVEIRHPPNAVTLLEEEFMDHDLLEDIVAAQGGDQIPEQHLVLRDAVDVTGRMSYRLLSPRLNIAGPSLRAPQNQFSPAYVNGLVPNSDYPTFLRDRRWPVSVATEDLAIEDGKPLPPALFFAHDIEHLLNRSPEPLLQDFGFVVLQAGVKVFPELDFSAAINPFLSGIEAFVSLCRELARPCKLKPILEELDSMQNHVEMAIQREELSASDIIDVRQRYPYFLGQIAEGEAALRTRYPMRTWDDLSAIIEKQVRWASQLRV